MVGHYCSIALVNFRKAPIATLANVMVLALGLTAFVAAYAITGFWSNADRHFANADRTFVISSRIVLADGTVVLPEVPLTNTYAASYLRADFPQIEAAARARSFGGDVPVAAGDRAIRLTAVAVDPEFLTIFDLPFVAGDARAALDEPRSVVLTRETAASLFGAAEPLGQIVSLANAVDATVTGVVDAIPEPSHMGRSESASLSFDMLTSPDLLDPWRRLNGFGGGGPENWFGMDGTTYLLFPADGSLTSQMLAAGLDAFLGRHMPAAQAAFGSLLLDLKPVTEMLALDASGAFLAGTASVTGLLWMLSALVLLVACVNYASLAAARAVRRTHEVGVRKAIGASAGDVLVQHLLEAGLLTAAALLLALAAVRALSPVILANAGIDLDVALSLGPRPLAFLAALALAVTLLAGAYPAFVLARVRPIFALRATRLRMRRRLLLSLLVGVQFAAASVLLTAVIVVFLQTKEIGRAGRGIAADPRLIIENRAEITHVDAETLHAELERLPRVTAVTAMHLAPFGGASEIPLARSADEEAVQRLVEDYPVSYDFADVLDLRLVAGRMFERGRDAGSARAGGQGLTSIVVDRGLVEQLGFASPEAAIGELVYVPRSFMMMGSATAAQARQIIGVVEGGPFGIRNDGAMYWLATGLPFTIVRLARDDVGAALVDIDALWKRLAPGIAPQLRFLDELFAEAAETPRIAYAFTALGVFAVLIATIGLFAMAQVVAARRVHEIGVRKTLGAATAQIVAMLLTSFSWPVVGATVVSWPIAFIAIRLYLDRFLNPIELNAIPFIVCLLVMLSIAWFAVGAQTLRAARTTPARVLRQE